MKHTSKIFSTRGAILGLSSIASAVTVSSAATQKPNILVVIVDDMGTEDTSVDFNYNAAGKAVKHVNPVKLGFPKFSQGNGHYITPNMEKLADQGMKFSRAYACQVCSPTRVSLMTGMNASRHGTFQYIGGAGSLHNLKAPRNSSLKYKDRALAEVFRDAGYRTIVAGKGHIGSDYNNKADNYKKPAKVADCFYGFQVNVCASSRPRQGSCYANFPSGAFGLSKTGVEAGFVKEYQNKTYNQLDPVAYPKGHALANEPVFVTEALTREMNERIEDSVKAGKPFFAYMSHFVVHDPHQLDPRFSANYPKLKGDVLDFATMIEGMDKSLGDIVAKLKELGVAENTLIVFLGDNGSDAKPRGPQNPPIITMSNPLRGEKGNAYEGGIRIPLIVSWAKCNKTNRFQKALAIAPKSREHDIVSVQDLYPTLLSIAGIALPTTDDNGKPIVIDGVDLKPYLKGTTGTHRPQTLITHAPCSSRSSFFTTYHDGDWKLIYGYTSKPSAKRPNIPLGSYELYNLRTDPSEAKNLAKSHPERTLAMAKAMSAELDRRGASYPILKSYDASLNAIGMPSKAKDTHPVILPNAKRVEN